MLDFIDLFNYSKPIADHWGEELCPLVLAEECGEMMQAISKYCRHLYFMGHANPEQKHAIADEMGDTMLMIMAVARVFDIHPDEIQDRIWYKAHLKKDGVV